MDKFINPNGGKMAITINDDNTQEVLDIKSDSLQLEAQRIEKSCAVCKFAIHCIPVGADEEANEVTCTVNPTYPCMKKLDDTCLKHQPKYKNLKILIEKDVLQEYDTEKIGYPLFNKIDNLPQLTPIGVEEWTK